MALQTTVYTDALNAQGVKRTYLNKTYYDKNLLVMAKTKFVHAEHGQKRTIPAGHGKRVEFRRFLPFDPKQAIKGLEEGVTPPAQDLAQTHLEVECRQFGAWTGVSDLLKTTSYDEIMQQSTDMLGEQLGTVAEWITRDAMNAGDNTIFADGQLNRLALTSAKVLTTTEIRKAVRALKKAKARPFTGNGRKPHFKCICSPDATYDLQDDEMWRDVSKYSNAEQIYTGEIGQIFGVVFIESTEAKVFMQTVLNKVNANVTSGTAFVLKNDPTEEEIEYLSTPGNIIKVGALTLTISETNPYTAATKTVNTTTTFTAQAGLAEDDIVYSEDAGAIDNTTKAGTDVYATLVFGKDAYGVVDIDGGSNIESIIHGLGSGGATDPLNQRASVGAKINSYAATILNDDWLVRIEHGVSA